MSEDILVDPPMGEVDSTPKGQFRLDVSIKGLPYVFEGQMPETPADFEFVVSLPPEEWAEIQPTIEVERASNSWFASGYKRLQTTLHLGEGKVGSVWVHPATTADGIDSVGIKRIQTENTWLPEGNKYYDAHGIGSFMLDNLCSLADVRGWRVYLEPLDHGGRLMQADLFDWYQRHGFEHSDSEIRSTAGGMVRLPQEPDPMQPVTSIATSI